MTTVTVTCPVCTNPRPIPAHLVRFYRARPHGFRCRFCANRRPRPGRIGATRAICGHCKKLCANRPRGLCWGCYYTPGVKDMYPPSSKYARRGVVNVVNFCGPAPLAPAPTAAMPGSPEKVAVMIERAAAGRAIFHPLDAAYVEDTRPVAAVPGRHSA